MSESTRALVTTLVTIFVVFGAVMTVCAYLVLLERKLSAWMQDRIGPNRVGPFGLLQPLADGIKTGTQRRSDARTRRQVPVSDRADDLGLHKR